MTIKVQSAHIVLYDSKKKLLLQHRTEDAKVLPGYWAFFGGGIEKNETPREAIYRETFEELNYKLLSPLLAISQSFEVENVGGEMYVFIEEFEGDKTTLKLGEGQGWGWFNEHEAKGLKMTDYDRNVIKSVFLHLQNEKYV
jgi:8-oxo-dGTP pyrophosphatase MutT (NUDIX family)